MVSATFLWSSFESSIRAQVPDAVWQSTFNPAKATSLEEDILELTVPSTIIKDRLEGEYFEVLRNALASSNATHITLKISTEQGSNDDDDHVTVASPPVAMPEVASSTPINRTTTALHPNYVFDKFVTGPSNRFALAAALSVAETPGKSYNPLFIHGHAGLGKTHLLQAIGHYVKSHYVDDQRHPIKRIVYVSTETFLNQFVDAIRTNTRSEFKKIYRDVDVLLVDDIQFLASREGTQIEFFHTFNSLHDAQKQIVISSDCAPHELQFLEERLRSRFEWGLTVDIQPPDLETRIAILKKKAEHLAPAIPIDDDVALYIAERIKSNIRELEGSLTTLIARASLWRRKITLALAQEVLPNIGDRDRPVVTIEIIQKHVANHYSLKLSELKSRNNSQTIVLPRQVAMYLARTLTGASYPQIARKFGKHYSTVIYAYDKIEEERGHDKSLDALIDGFIKSIKKSVD